MSYPTVPLPSTDSGEPTMNVRDDGDDKLAVLEQR